MGEASPEPVEPSAPTASVKPIESVKPTESAAPTARCRACEYPLPEKAVGACPECGQRFDRSKPATFYPYANVFSKPFKWIALVLYTVTTIHVLLVIYDHHLDRRQSHLYSEHEAGLWGVGDPASWNEEERAFMASVEAAKHEFWEIEARREFIGVGSCSMPFVVLIFPFVGCLALAPTRHFKRVLGVFVMFLPCAIIAFTYYWLLVEDPVRPWDMGRLMMPHPGERWP